MARIIEFGMHRDKKRPVKIVRTHWTPANRWTFEIPVISQLLEEEIPEPSEDVTPENLYSTAWLDSFAGHSQFSLFTNDQNPHTGTVWHYDALRFLKMWPDDLFGGCLYDPPYSFGEAKKNYESYGADQFPEVPVTRMDYWSRCKDEVARIVRPGGKVICCGWNSMGLGGRRGFEMKRILLVPHGGSRNDTIVTVETKGVGQHFTKKRALKTCN